jgi:hypothetical protein
MRELPPGGLQNWELEKERSLFFDGYPAGPLRQDRSGLPDVTLRPWLQDHRGLAGYPRAVENGYVTVARLLSLHRDDSDSEGSDISATYAWIGPEGEVHRDSVMAGYDRYSPGGLGALLEDQSLFIVEFDERAHRTTLQSALFSVLPSGLPSALVSGWPQVKPAVLTRLLQLKTLPVSLVVLQQGGRETPEVPPGAITFPLPSAFPSREGLIFPSAVPEVEAFHDLPFSSVKRGYTVINSPDFERRLSELDPAGMVVIASRDEALSRRFTHLLRGLRRVQRRPFFHISYLAGNVSEVQAG